MTRATVDRRSARLIAQVATTHGMIYLRSVPKTLPADHVLVHNVSAWPGRRLGSNGFRAWLSPRHQQPERWEPCACGWASELGSHFRTSREP